MKLNVRRGEKEGGCTMQISQTRGLHPALYLKKKGTVNFRVEDAIFSGSANLRGFLRQFYRRVKLGRSFISKQLQDYRRRGQTLNTMKRRL